MNAVNDVVDEDVEDALDANISEQATAFLALLDASREVLAVAFDAPADALLTVEGRQRRDSAVDQLRQAVAFADGPESHVPRMTPTTKRCPGCGCVGTITGAVIAWPRKNGTVVRDEIARLEDLDDPTFGCGYFGCVED